MSLYVRAITYFRQDLGKIVLSLLMTAAGVAAGVLWPLPLAILIDVVLSDKHRDYLPYRLFERFAPHDKTTQVILLAALMLGVRLLAELLQMLRTIVNIRVGYSGTMRVRCEL